MSIPQSSDFTQFNFGSQSSLEDFSDGLLFIDDGSVVYSPASIQGIEQTPDDPTAPWILRAAFNPLLAVQDPKWAAVGPYVRDSVSGNIYWMLWWMNGPQNLTVAQYSSPSSWAANFYSGNQQLMGAASFFVEVEFDGSIVHYRVGTTDKAYTEVAAITVTPDRVGFGVNNPSFTGGAGRKTGAFLTDWDLV
jgi:hypothetical protein